MYSLQIGDIHKRYGSHEVLRGISFRAGKGDVISIISSSDLDKSTFLRCVNSLGKPYAGRTRVGDGELHTRPGTLGELHAADPRQLQRIRGRLVIVFQHFNLQSHLTVLENAVECPANVLRMNCDDAVTRAHHYLTKVGLARKVGRQCPCELSDGQQQRVAIARALTMGLQMILFDEPTSALNPELVGEVLKVIQQLAKEGRAMVLVTHGMTFARQTSNYVTFLHQGAIEEQGMPDQVLGAPCSECLRRFLVSNLK